MTDQEQTERGASTVEVIEEILREVADTPPWAYTYRERPDDLLEIRTPELQAILEAHIPAVLRADLERVTGERDYFRDGFAAADRAGLALTRHLDRVEAERDAMREVVELAAKEANRHKPEAFATSRGYYCGGCSSNAQPWPCQAAPMIDAIARLDATRKATADA